MKSSLITILVLLSLLMACIDQSSIQRGDYFSIDSLVNAQVAQLAAGNFVLEKTASLNGVQEHSSTSLDSAGWARELDIIRRADINKPAYSNAFKISISDDLNSNLKLKTYQLQNDLPVKSLKIYYLNDVNEIRRIRASIEEETRVFVNDKEILLEFDIINNQLLLKKYLIEGKQKMILGDSTYYRIAGEIISSQ
ncbi:MAG TPA: hypothetical protein PKC24_06260 [Cyclobacteriaceae bacterium]|nr:hypothetical protein [Cyclobacteriaceae bacterium]